MSKLVHINKVEFVSSDEMPTVLIISTSKCRLLSEGNWKPMCLKGLADVIVEGKRENNQSIYNVKATFRTENDGLAYLGETDIYRLTSVTGQQYLLGNGLRPYPVTQVAVPRPGKETDSPLVTWTVSWTSPNQLLEILP